MSIEELREFVDSVEELKAERDYYKKREEILLKERNAIIKCVNDGNFDALQSYLAMEH